MTCVFLFLSTFSRSSAHWPTTTALMTCFQLFSGAGAKSKSKVKIVRAGAHLFLYAKQSRSTHLDDRRITIQPLRHADIIHSWKFWKLFNFESFRNYLLQIWKFSKWVTAIIFIGLPFNLRHAVIIHSFPFSTLDTSRFSFVFKREIIVVCFELLNCLIPPGSYNKYVLIVFLAPKELYTWYCPMTIRQQQHPLFEHTPVLNNNFEYWCRDDFVDCDFYED